MKKLSLPLYFLLVSFCLLNQNLCPPEGNAKTDKKRESNRQKNRSVEIKANPQTVSIDELLKDGDDLSRFNYTDYVSVTGYVVETKDGGSESCNCNSKEKKDHDVHMYIGKTWNEEKKNCFIAETTPPFKSIHPIDYNSLQGKKIKITGYMFYDSEHKGNALNSCKKCGNAWRKTAWEVHPVVKLEILN